MNPFMKGKALWVNDVEMRVGRQIGPFEVQLENTHSGEITTHKIFTLLEQYTRGEVLTAAQRRHMLRAGEMKPKTPARMGHMSPQARSESTTASSWSDNKCCVAAVWLLPITTAVPPTVIFSQHPHDGNSAVCVWRKITDSNGYDCP